MTEQVFFFGPFRVATALRQFEKNGRTVKLPSRAFDLLCVLLEHKGSILSRDELTKLIWKDTVVDNGSLRVLISTLRRALGDERGSARYVLSVPGRGYCFAEQAISRRLPQNTSVENRAIPTLLTRVIGREEAVHSASYRLLHGRFVTIAGPGGVGKTTVALAIANGMHAPYDDGAYFVELANVRERAELVAAIAACLKVGANSDNQMGAIVFHLTNRHALIVFDNCEHLVEDVAQIAEAILAAAPNVHILTTSREPLNAAGEWVMRLPSLTVPDDASDMTMADIVGHSAVELFLERATAIAPGITTDDNHALAIAAICRRLDGIPLAIELAAARVEEFGLTGVADRLDDRFSFLTRGRRTALPRQKTLLATMDWSYELLSDAEAKGFTRLSVFPGSFSHEAALDIMASNDYSRQEAEESLAGLVAKSLISVNGAAVPQFRMLATTMDYALRKLSETDGWRETRKRHAAYSVQLSKAAASDREQGLSPGWSDVYGPAISDVRAALAWAFGPDGDAETGIELTACSATLFISMGLMDEYRKDVERAILAHEKTDSPDLRLTALLYAARGAALYRYANNASQTAFEVSLEAARAAGDIPLQLRIIQPLSAAYLIYGNYAEALRVGERFNPLPGGRTSAVARTTLAHSNFYAGHFIEAKQQLDQLLPSGGEDLLDPAARKQDDRRKINLRATKSLLLWITGFPDQALALAKDCVQDALDTGQIQSFTYSVTAAAFPIAFNLRGTGAAQEFYQAHLGIVRKHALDAWLPLVNTYGAMLTPRKERPGTAAERDLLEASTIFHQGAHLEYLSILGHRSTERWMIERALRTHSGWCRPELLRARGDIALFDDAEPEAAERLFRQSLSMARNAHAVAWELKAAISLADFLAQRGERQQAADLLAEIIGRFSEGYETLDYRRATGLFADSR